jgi:hypothetical protein
MFSSSYRWLPPRDPHPLPAPLDRDSPAPPGRGAPHRSRGMGAGILVYFCMPLMIALCGHANERGCLRGQECGGHRP